MSLKRTVIYTAPRSQTMHLDDLANLIVEVQELSGWNYHPVVTIQRTSTTAASGEIKKVSIDGTPDF